MRVQVCSSSSNNTVRDLYIACLGAGAHGLAELEVLPGVMLQYSAGVWCLLVWVGSQVCVVSSLQLEGSCEGWCGGSALPHSSVQCPG